MSNIYCEIIIDLTLIGNELPRLVFDFSISTFNHLKSVIDPDF